MDFGYYFTRMNIPNFEISFPKIDFQGINFSFFSFLNTNNSASNESIINLNNQISQNNNSLFNYTQVPSYIPAFNFYTPLFYMPFINQSKYYQTSEKKSESLIQQATPQKAGFIEQNTSNVDSKIVQSTVKNTSSQFKSKTKKEKIGSQTVKAEEIKSGYYIKKFDGVDIQGLNPGMKETVVKMNKKAKELGYDLVISSAYRSHEKQMSLKKQKPKLAASLYKSAHEYGAAIDIGLYKNGKKVNISNVKEFVLYAESLGLTWGGRWKRQCEPWHFNLNNWQNLAEVRDEYRRLNNLA